MENASRGSLLFQNPKRIVCRLAGVDDDGQASLVREADLRSKHLVLHVARREVVVIVESDLSEPAGAGAIDRGDHGRDPLFHLAGELACVMRMNPGCEPRLRPCPADELRARHFGVVFSLQYAEGGVHARLACPGSDEFKVPGEFVAREMAVSVDESAGVAAQVVHRTRTPGGISWSKPTSVGLPPSGLAASTIPLDSMPISFAGFRLKTMTMVRPTSCSGS